MRALQDACAHDACSITRSTGALLTYPRQSPIAFRRCISIRDEPNAARFPRAAQARIVAHATADAAAAEIPCRFHDRHRTADRDRACAAHPSHLESGPAETRCAGAAP